MDPKYGDTVKVELNDGTEMVGTFSLVFGNDCIRNPHGFPISFKRVIEVL